MLGELLETATAASQKMSAKLFFLPSANARVSGSKFLKSIMAKSSDPTIDPEFQKAVQALLKAPPQPHKPLGKRKPKAPRKDESK